MTDEQKQLLIKDLCARTPYGVKLLYNSNSIANIKDRVEILRGITIGYTILFETDYIHSEYESTSGSYEHFKPYLRPMSSMTESEYISFSNILHKWFDDELFILTEESFIEYALSVIGYSVNPILFDWLNAHYFDYRGLIEKGLALVAPADMYNFK